MRQFKKIDCILQVGLLLVAFSWNLAALLRGNFVGNDPFIAAYFAVGGWQFLSTVVHMLKPQYNKKMPRRIYLISLLAVVLGAIISYLQGDAVLLFFYVLLFAAPVMAIYYCIICVVETGAIKNTAAA